MEHPAGTVRNEFPLWECEPSLPSLEPSSEGFLVPFRDFPLGLGCHSPLSSGGRALPPFFAPGSIGADSTPFV